MYGAHVFICVDVCPGGHACVHVRKVWQSMPGGFLRLLKNLELADWLVWLPSKLPGDPLVSILPLSLSTGDADMHSQVQRFYMCAGILSSGLYPIDHPIMLLPF